MSRVLGLGVLAEQKTVTTTTLKWAGVQVQLEICKYNKDSRLTKQTVSNYIGWVGGKARIAKALISMMPAHHEYCEVFFGGGSVFFTIFTQLSTLACFNISISSCLTVTYSA